MILDSASQFFPAVHKIALFISINFFPVTNHAELDFVVGNVIEKPVISDTKPPLAEFHVGQLFKITARVGVFLEFQKSFLGFAPEIRRQFLADFPGSCIADHLSLQIDGFAVLQML